MKRMTEVPGVKSYGELERVELMVLGFTGFGRVSKSPWVHSCPSKNLGYEENRPEPSSYDRNSIQVLN